MGRGFNYILDEQGDPVPCPDLLTWAEWMETADRHVGWTVISVVDDVVVMEEGEGQGHVGDVIVSTVFLGMDHNWVGDDPILFETMIYAITAPAASTAGASGGGEATENDTNHGRQFLNGSMRYKNRDHAQWGHEAFVRAVGEKLIARGGRELLLSEGLGQLDADDQEELPG